MNGKRTSTLISVIVLVAAVFFSSLPLMASAAQGVQAKSGTVPLKQMAAVAENPIIVIPGVMGSNLYSSNTTFNSWTRIWSPPVIGITQLGRNIGMDKTLYPRPAENQNAAGVSREYGATGLYQETIDTLCNRFPDREIYMLSYDFRQANTQNAEYLKTQIDRILAGRPGKVDIIGHSMGGYLVSSYIKKYGTGSIGKVFTVATPYEGSPKLIKAVLHWDLVDGVLENLLLGAVGGLTKEIKAKFPASAQLEPTMEYLSRNPFYQYSHTESSGFLGLRKTKIYNPLDTAGYEAVGAAIFAQNHGEARTYQASIKNGGMGLLAGYENAYFILGVNQPTIESLKFNKANTLGTIQVEDLVYENLGDGTVPYDSASMLGQLKNIPGAAARVREFDASHMGLLNQGSGGLTDKALQWIGDILERGGSDIQSDRPAGKNYVVLRVACPVDVTVRGSSGELKSAASEPSDLTSFGRLDFLGTDNDVKMICLENWKDYGVTLTGTADGAMDYAIRWFDSRNRLVDERVFYDVPLTEDTVIRTDADKSGATTLTVDSDGDGKTDQIWTADAGGVGEKKYTVAFNSVGGSAVSKQQIAKNGAVKKPKNPVRKGYVFKGWYRDKTYKKVWRFDGKVTSNITLHAKWIRAMGKIGPAGAKTVRKGGQIRLTVSGNAPIKKVVWKSSAPETVAAHGAAEKGGKVRTTCVIKGLKPGGKAVISAVVSFKDGTVKTVTRTIKVKR